MCPKCNKDYLIPLHKKRKDNDDFQNKKLQLMSMERRYVPGTIYMVKPLCNAPYTSHIENITILKLR